MRWTAWIGSLAIALGACDSVDPEVGGASSGAEDKGLDGAIELASDSGRGEPDGEVVADAEVTSDASSSCEQQKRTLSEFVAAHRSCNDHTDCAAIGSCSNSDFVVVSTSARTEAEALVAARCDIGVDGPTYYGGCRDHQCELLHAPRWCGEAPSDPLCSRDRAYYAPGCGEGEPFAAGCHKPCDGPSGASVCDPGYHCAQTNFHPCRPPATDPGAIVCQACGAETSLCLPDADCDLWLSVEFEGRDERYGLAPNTASKMFVVLENPHDEARTATLPGWCHGPTVVGLGTYDLFDACLAGACDVIHDQTLTLAPHERRVMREVLLASGPTTCNPEGLAPGQYQLRWELPAVTDAKVCSRPPAELGVTNKNMDW